MIQDQVHLEGRLAECSGCGRQPRAYFVRGKGLHLLECAACGMRTAKLPTMQEAVAQWEAQETQETQTVALRR